MIVLKVLVALIAIGWVVSVLWVVVGMLTEKEDF